MEISKIEDNNTDFDSVYIDPKTNTPHCKKHGAMNKVSTFPDRKGGYWRCISTITKKLDNACRTGCVQN